MQVVLSQVYQETLGMRSRKSRLVHRAETPSGAIAQLVERLLCKQNVLGSNPCGSTIFHFEISGLLAQLVRASC